MRVLVNTSLLSSKLYPRSLAKYHNVLQVLVRGDELQIYLHSSPYLSVQRIADFFDH